MNKPFFSVIVPAHNAAGRIRRLLDSIKMQTFDDYEVIIVCDDCQDGTAEIAAEYVDNAFPQGQVLEVGWHSCGKTRNAALELANGEWVLFSDDDDWWREDTAFAMIAETIQNYESIREPFDILAFNFIFGYNGLARQFTGSRRFRTVTTMVLPGRCTRWQGSSIWTRACITTTMKGKAASPSSCTVAS